MRKGHDRRMFWFWVSKVLEFGVCFYRTVGFQLRGPFLWLHCLNESGAMP